MIDTVKFKIPIEEDLFKVINRKSNVITKKNNESNIIEFRILNKDLNIGSFDKKITIKAYDSSYILLEMSLPKFAFGNNVELLYPSSIEKVLARIQNCLRNHFGDFPSYRIWTLERLDICYAWRLPTQALAEKHLDIIKTFDYPRKNRYLYKDSVMWRGRHYSLKFYLKLPEFIKHDYKQLIKLRNRNFANYLYNLAIGTLRFEVTLRKGLLIDLFDKKEITYADILSNKVIETYLKTYFDKLVANLDKEVMEKDEVMEKLEKCYPNRTAIRLFIFYRMYNSPLIQDRQMLKKHYNPSTIWRNKRDIAHAGVGLPNFELTTGMFSLMIPSEFVVNQVKTVGHTLRQDSNTA